MNIDYDILATRLSALESRVAGGGFAGGGVDKSSSSSSSSISSINNSSSDNGGGGGSGSDSHSNQASSQQSVSRDMMLLEGRLEGFISSCPDLLVCERHLQDLTPLFLGKGGSLVALAASLNDVIARRDSIIRAVSNLNEMKSLYSHIDVSVDDAVFNRLLAFENDIADMERALDVQSQEVIEMLDYYDAAMAILSETSMNWDTIR